MSVQIITCQSRSGSSCNYSSWLSLIVPISCTAQALLHWQPPQGERTFLSPCCYCQSLLNSRSGHGGGVTLHVWWQAYGAPARQSQIVQMEANRVQRPLDILRYSHTVFKNTGTCFARAGVWLWQVNVGQDDNKPFYPVHTCSRKIKEGVNACFAFPSVPEDMRGKDDGTDCGWFWNF